MSNVFSKLLSNRKSSAKAIEELKAVQLKNEEDRNWRKNFAKKSEELLRKRGVLEYEFAGDPSDELALEYLELSREIAGTAEALNRLTTLSADKVQQRIDSRTRPVLKTALQCIVDDLTAEKLKIEQQNAAQARDLGVEVDEVRSPLVLKLDTEIGRLQNFISRVDAASSGELSKFVSACLDRS